MKQKYRYTKPIKGKNFIKMEDADFLKQWLLESARLEMEKKVIKNEKNK
jgi:hypothetical protein